MGSEDAPILPAKPLWTPHSDSEDLLNFDNARIRIGPTGQQKVDFGKFHRYLVLTPQKEATRAGVVWRPLGPEGGY
jgi:hypothetical protein